MKTKKKIKTAVNNFVNYYKKGIKSFSEVYIPETVISVDVSGNPLLTSFEGLAPFPQMNMLKANDTRISTFKGAQTQTSLMDLSLLNTPLSKEKHLVFMSLVAFGSSLQNVNGKLVLPEMRVNAARLKSKVIPYLERGYLVSSIEPELKVHLPGSQRDIIVDLELNEFLEKEKLINDNDKKIQEMKKKILLLQKEKREKKLEKVDRKKVIDSFLSPSPKKTKKSTNVSRTSKQQTYQAKPKPNNIISPPIQSKKQKDAPNINKNQNKLQQKPTTNTTTKKQTEQLHSEIKSKEEEKPTNINEEKEENIFNFSDDEAKEEEESTDLNKTPKKIAPISSEFPNDDQLVDTGDDPEHKQTNGFLDQDLYNDLVDFNDENEDKHTEEENQNELQPKEDDNANTEEEDDKPYSGKIEFTEKDDINNNIFNFSDEEEEEDSPDVAAMKVDMNTPKKKFEIHHDSQDDDLMIDFGDELSQTQEEETLLSDAKEEDDQLLSDPKEEEDPLLSDPIDNEN